MLLGKRLIKSREESAVVGLTKKLKRESEKRVGAERDAANWKKKYKDLEETVQHRSSVR